MSTPNGKSVCKPLGETVAINLDSYLYADIQTEPLFPNPLSLEEIRENSDARLLYLSSASATSCAYPIRTSPHEEDAFFPERIIDERFWRDGVPRFGIPTQLRTATPNFKGSGVIYDRQQELYYASDIEQGQTKWYLIGDDVNYKGFLNAITQFADYLGELAAKHPGVLFEKAWGFSAAEKAVKIPSHREAEREIEKFLAWLKDVDPQLFSDVAPLTSFAPRLNHDSFLEAYFCGITLNSSAYAYYDSSWNRIHLLPKAIEMLKAKQYESVAAILAHEWSHKKVRGSGLTMPSYELLQRSIDLFLDKAAEEHPPVLPLIAIFQGVIRTGLQCVFLFGIPEEEVQAHTQDFVYSVLHPVGSGTRKVQNESLETIDHFWNFTTSYYPSDWLRLSMQYYNMASRLHSRGTQAKDEVIDLFFKDLEERWSCADQASKPCPDSSGAWKKLEELRHPEAVQTSPSLGDNLAKWLFTIWGPIVWPW